MIVLGDPRPSKATAHLVSFSFQRSGADDASEGGREEDTA